jgi:hypothetical protein
LTSTDFSSFQIGDRIMIIDGLAGGTDTAEIEAIHHDEEVIVYKAKNGQESFVLFEEVIKKL